MVVNQNRRHRRHMVRGEGRLEMLDERLQVGPAVEVSIQDLGRTGCMMLMDRPIEPGTTWRLRVVNKGQLVGSQPLVVRWCRREDAGFSAGAQFVIEPFLLRHLGVSEAAITAEELAQEYASYSQPQQANAAALA